MPITQYTNTNLGGATGGPSGQPSGPVFGEVVGAVHGEVVPSGKGNSNSTRPIPTDVPGSIRVTKPSLTPSERFAVVSVVDRTTSKAVSQIMNLDGHFECTVPDMPAALVALPSLVPSTLRVDYLNTPAIPGKDFATSIQKALLDSGFFDKKRLVNVELAADADSSDQYGVMQRAILNITASVKVAFISKQTTMKLSIEIQDMATRKARMVMDVIDWSWWLPNKILKLCLSSAQTALDGFSRLIQGDHAITHWCFTVRGRSPVGSAASAGAWVSSIQDAEKTSAGWVKNEVDLAIDTA